MLIMFISPLLTEAQRPMKHAAMVQLRTTTMMTKMTMKRTKRKAHENTIIQWLESVLMLMILVTFSETMSPELDHPERHHDPVSVLADQHLPMVHPINTYPGVIQSTST